MAIPLIGAAIRLGGSVLAKVAGKALKRATKGKLIGAGGGMELAKTAAKVGGGLGVTLPILRSASVPRSALTPGRGNFGPDLNPFGTNERTGATFGFGGRRKYRRMNPMNHRALRRSVRRLEMAEKLFRKVFTISGGRVTPKKRTRR